MLSSGEAGAEAASSDATQAQQLDWHDIVAKLGLTGLVSQVASHCLLQDYTDGRMRLMLDETGTGLMSDSAHATLQQALSDWAGSPVKLHIDVSRVQAETPAMRYARIQQETQQHIEELIRQDPFVQQLQAELGGEIVPGSIKTKKKGKS